MATYPEISSRRERQIAPGRDIEVLELQFAVITRVISKPAVGVLLTRIAVQLENCINRMRVITVKPFINNEIKSAGIFITKPPQRAYGPGPGCAPVSGTPA